MSQRAHIIRADGSFEWTDPTNGKEFSYEEITAIVGGYIELMALSDGTFMIFNETGKMDGLPRNVRATEVLRTMSQALPLDWIAGDVLICGRDQLRKE